MAVIDPGQAMMQEGLEFPVTAEEDLALQFVLPDEVLDRKVRALRCQASQVDRLADHMGEELFRELNRDEQFRPETPDDWPAET